MFDVGVEFDLIRDLILFADFMIVLHDLGTGRVERRPIWVLSEGEGIKCSGDITVEVSALILFRIVDRRSKWSSKIIADTHHNVTYHATPG